MVPAGSLVIIASTLIIVLVLIVQWRQDALARHEFRMTVHEMIESVATERGEVAWGIWTVG
jgi:hypothetical protein